MQPRAPHVAADVTILFVDIVGYTAFAEVAAPEEVVRRLNEFFELAIPIVTAHGGHTNKLLGDGFMAVFGAPTDLADHADRALSAALEIEARRRHELEGGVAVGMGLNSGRVVAGAMGGGDRFEYAVVGDAVNVAARVEAQTRFTGDAILLTAATRSRLLAVGCGFESRGSVLLKGRAREVELFAVTSGGQRTAPSPSTVYVRDPRVDWPAVPSVNVKSTHPVATTV